MLDFFFLSVLVVYLFYSVGVQFVGTWSQVVLFGWFRAALRLLRPEHHRSLGSSRFSLSPASFHSEAHILDGKCSNEHDDAHRYAGTSPAHSIRGSPCLRETAFKICACSSADGIAGGDRARDQPRFCLSAMAVRG